MRCIARSSSAGASIRSTANAPRAVVGEVAGDHQRLAVGQVVDLGVELDADVARQRLGARQVARHLGRRHHDLGRQQARPEALGLLRLEALGGEAHALGAEPRGAPGQSRRAPRERARARSRPRKSTNR